MRIKTLNIPVEYTQKYGLKPIKIAKLQNVVLLAGQNGSGKSRFFQLLEDFFQHVPTIATMENLRKDILHNKAQVEKTREAIERLETHAPENRNQFIKGQLLDFNTQLSDLNNAIASAEDKICNAELMTFSISNNGDSFVKFVPKQTILKDSYAMPPSAVIAFANSLQGRKGVETMPDCVFAFIQYHQNQWRNVRLASDDLEVDEKIKNSILNNYARLKNHIKLFLKTDLKTDKDGNATLFDLRLGASNLSDGQKVLLQLCIALFVQEATLAESIILMDEPENHLHPAMLIEVLDRIVENIPSGQLWIATHSINILAHFDSSCIFYLEDGAVQYAGDIPEKVLVGLLGGEDETEKLSSFLSLPAQMASEKFAFECLLSPQVAWTSNEDSQTTQIQKAIKVRLSGGESKLKVFDYGMGKGRLISSIAENERLAGIDVTSWLDYIGYDKYASYKPNCETILAGIYDEGNRYYNDASLALAALDEASFDFIVMCNVLHEIDPIEWQNLFTGTNSLMTLLKPDGHLMIVEDQFLAVGEKAHSKGFLVLDELELKRLFAINNGPRIITYDYRNDKRLKAHLIPACQIGNMSLQTRQATFNTLIGNSKQAIKKLREMEPNFKNGKRLAFWTQQLANAMLALEEIS